MLNVLDKSDAAWDLYCDARDKYEEAQDRSKNLQAQLSAIHPEVAQEHSSLNVLLSLKRLFSCRDSCPNLLEQVANTLNNVDVPDGYSVSGGAANRPGEADTHMDDDAESVPWIKPGFPGGAKAAVVGAPRSLSLGRKARDRSRSPPPGGER